MTTPHLKKSIDGSPSRLGLLLIPLVFACFGLSPTAQAVSPPPDGGYPNGNTAEGVHALFSLTIGGYNTAVGLFSLAGNTEGSFNTGVGASALRNNTSGSTNTANGFEALFSNTTGVGNTAVGAGALTFNDPNPNIENSGSGNTAVGSLALSFNTVGFGNTAVGVTTLLQNTKGFGNTALGAETLAKNTEASGNTAVGARALQNNTGPGKDGDSSLNTAVGVDALSSNTTGGFNTAVGAGTNDGPAKSAPLGRNTTGIGNTAVGAAYQDEIPAALGSNTTGDRNTAIGNGALSNNTTGIENIAVGFLAGSNVKTATNAICIGSAGTNESKTCFIGNIFGKGTPAGASVLISENGRLGTLISSKRFKEDIQPMDKASEALFSLKPVSFRYKKEIDPAGTPQLGLVAEDVEKVNPGLIVRDKEGKPYSVRYEQVNAMLLNEFLKEHKAFVEEHHNVEKLQVTVAQQQKQIEALTAGLQKVSARLEVSKAEPQTVLNND